MDDTTGTTDNLAESDPPEALSRSIDCIANSARERIDRATESRELRTREEAEEADRHLKNSNRIEREGAESIEEIDRVYQIDLEQIDEAGLIESREFEDSLLSSRREIKSHEKKTVQNLQSRMEEACWLAEAVYEANENKPRTDFEQYREKVETRKMELEEVITLARTEVKRYRQRARVIRTLTEEEQQTIRDNPTQTFSQASSTIIDALSGLKSLKFARSYRGALPILIAVGFVGAGLGISFLSTGLAKSTSTELVSGALIGAAAGLLVLGFGWFLARKQVKRCWRPLRSMNATLDSLTEVLVEKARESRAHQDKAFLGRVLHAKMVN